MSKLLPQPPPPLPLRCCRAGAAPTRARCWCRTTCPKSRWVLGDGCWVLMQRRARPDGSLSRQGSSSSAAVPLVPACALQDFFQKECWAHHPKPHQEYMDMRRKQVGCVRVCVCGGGGTLCALPCAAPWMAVGGGLPGDDMCGPAAAGWRWQWRLSEWWRRRHGGLVS